MAGSSEPAQKKPPLSCTSCRARKLKCDKQDPCHHCVRSNVECVFPARRRIQRPRKSKNSELLQRLDRLETIVGKVGLANLEALEARVEAVGARGAEVEPPQPVEADLRPPDDDVVAAYGVQDVRPPPPPPQDNTASRYMGGKFWSSLCNEVEGLRQVLEQATDSEDEEEDGGEGTTPESVGGRSGTTIQTPPSMLLGTPQTVNLHGVEHPSPNDIRYLASVYFRNVDMHLKILHRPTVLAALSHLADHPDTASDLSPELTALFFAIYYAAVTSQTSEECAHALGRPRADLAVSFQAGVEQALARADYLNNAGLETLQALTLYVCCLRSHNGSRASWVLLGLLIRLAQALDIHQDGDGSDSASASRFTPFEAELRRRLWWQLIVLDIRAAEDRGTNTIIARGSYDTRLPYNIDDAEFGPDTTAPLRDRPGPSDTTFCLFTAQSSGIFLRTSQDAGIEEETIHRTKHLELQYLKGADPSHVGSYLASIVVRIIILKMWLVMRYPLHPRDRRPAAMTTTTTTTTTTTQENASYARPPDAYGLPTSKTFTPLPLTETASATLCIAISIMQLSDFLETGEYSDRVRWWCETYVQWHPLAVALAELCTQTRGAMVERAWRIIEVVFPRWSDKIADAKRGSLWRPIRKLYKKAKAAREATLSLERGSESSAQSQSQSLWGVPASSSIAALGAQLSNLEPRPDYMAIDPALTGDLQPGVIPDVILPEPPAQALTSAAPIPSLFPSTASAGLSRTETPGIPLFPSPRGTVEPTPYDLDAIMGDSGQSMAQTLLAWPGISFDMPALSSTGSQDLDGVNAQAPTSMMASTIAGERPVSDPALLETDMMNWSTWDEFILETYADSTPPSGSGQSGNN
ncbi:fungal-specific transcription factor domain-containing protein [Nemania sp. NC0429]|nr:fungal-specific transcription factor domain-containing protein [Nemania sp. NC0429]